MSITNKFNWQDFKECARDCFVNDYFMFLVSFTPSVDDGWWYGFSKEKRKKIEDKIKNGNYKKKIINFTSPKSWDRAERIKNILSKLNPAEMIIKNVDDKKYDVYYK